MGWTRQKKITANTVALKIRVPGGVGGTQESRLFFFSEKKELNYLLI